ncbi:MAG TPA: ABC transporter permease [Gaiellaceae bacterium]|jgi:lipooligosaccharide transport system permease protein
MTALALTLARLPAHRSRLLVERNFMVYRRTWMIVFSGFFEPLLYLFSLGLGLGHFVGTVPGPDGAPVEYASFVAPALLAAAAMNGSIYDATNVFWKMRYGRVYDAMLATPLGPVDVAVGETAWALFRGFLYAVAFLVTAAALGLVESPWAVLALPASVLVGFAFAGAGVAAATYMRTWHDFELLSLVQLPMFLFSTTFYPLSTYPDWLQDVVRLTPLYHAIELLRTLMLGGVGPAQIVNCAYLVALGIVGVVLARRRIHRLLLK